MNWPLPPAASQPVREHLHPRGHPAERARLHQRYRCWRREALAALPLDRFISDGYSFLVEMLFVAARAAAAGSPKCRSPSSSGARANRSCRGPCCSSRRSRRGGSIANPRTSRKAPREPSLSLFVLWFRGIFTCQLQPARSLAGLSVFFPAYNDSGTIASMVIRAVQAASALTPDYEVIVVNDGSADATARDRRRAGAHLSARPRRPPSEEPRLRRRAADRLPIGDQGADLLHRRRRAVRPGRAGGALGRDDAPTPIW